MLVYLHEVSFDYKKFIKKNKNNFKLEDCAFYYIESALENAVYYSVEKIDEEYGTFSYSIGTVFFIDLGAGRCEVGMLPDFDDEWVNEAKEIALKQMLDKLFDKMEFHEAGYYVFFDGDEIELSKKAGMCEDDDFKIEVNGRRVIKMMSKKLEANYV